MKVLQRLIGGRDPVEPGLEHLEPEHGALHPRRADRHSELLQEILPADRFHLCQWPSIGHLSQDRGRRLADRAAAAGESDLRYALAVALHIDADLISTERIHVLVAEVGGFERAL